MFKLDLDKAEEPEMKSPRSAGSQRKQESSSKTCTSALLMMPKPLTVWITINCGKLWKRWEYQNTLHASWEICMQVKKQQLELGMEQWTGSKLGKEFVMAVYCHPVYLTYMQSTSWDMLGWIKHKLESRLLGEISITSDICRWHHPYGRKRRGTKESPAESERGEWKSWLKIQYSKKLRLWHPVLSLHGKYMGKQWKQWQTLFSWAPKSVQMVTADMKLKDTCSLEEKLWPT